MVIDEGGIPKGNLSDYISGVFASRAQQVQEAARLRDSVAQAKLDHFVEVTSPLRYYLLQLAASIEELLTRFRVRELLDEGKVIVNSDNDKKFRQKYNIRPDEVLTGYYDYKVVELRPEIYKQVVSNPQPRESFDLDGSVVDVDTLSKPENFRELIPQLVWYGLALRWENPNRLTVPARVMRYEWVEASSHHKFWSVGAGDVYETTPGHFTLREVSEDAPVRVSKSFLVLGEKAEAGSNYDLSYSHLLRRFDLRAEDQKHYNPQDSYKYLNPPRRVIADDPIEVLQKLIGDDVISEVDGKYSHEWWLFQSGTVPKNS